MRTLPAPAGLAHAARLAQDGLRVALLARDAGGLLQPERRVGAEGRH